MNVCERVRSVVAEVLDVPAEKITPETSLTDDLAADSLTRVEIVMALEGEFGIEFEEETLSLTTLSQIVDYIESQ
jgi:acyl carrier protein